MLAESRTCRGHSNKGAEFSAELVHRIGNLQLITFSRVRLEPPFPFDSRSRCFGICGRSKRASVAREVSRTHGVFDPQALNPEVYPRRQIRHQSLIVQACEI